MAKVIRVFVISNFFGDNSLDCKEGHMKKNSLFVCLFVCSLDCREGHMKKNSLWVGLCQVKGQKNIIFSKNVQKSKEHRFGWVQRSKKLGGTLRSSSAILGGYP
jgi:hypothetical protein